jgi:hypothetical protein
MRALALLAVTLLATALPELATAATRAESVERDQRGRIARSAKARILFKRDQPCPATGKHWGKCPGYVIDHVIALKRGGPDHPSNMQWQTTADAKEKDRWE